MTLTIAATAYALPSKKEEVSVIIQRESERVEEAQRQLSFVRKGWSIADLGIESVRVCDESEPYDLAWRAVQQAVRDAGVNPREIDLIVDFSTLPGNTSRFLPLGQKLSAELEADESLNICFKIGGCAGLHMALKTASALMKTDDTIATALLVTADSPPKGNRTILPLSIQGDAASAVIVRRSLGELTLLSTEVTTLGYLHDTIVLESDGIDEGKLNIVVNQEKIERDLIPIYYLNFYRLIQRILERNGLELSDIDHFVYTNLSNIDQEGFVEALRIPREKIVTGNQRFLGHTFASDLVINYSDLRQRGEIQSGQLLLFASAGIGFTWGVTLARAQ